MYHVSNNCSVFQPPNDTNKTACKQCHCYGVEGKHTMKPNVLEQIFTDQLENTTTQTKHKREPTKTESEITGNKYR